MTAAVLDGPVVVDGFAVRPTAAKSMDVNSRRMLELDFDVAEMSFATFVWARVTQGLPVLALPVFTGRRFPQPLAFRHRKAGISGPSDLAGRRVAMPQFWMTSSVWHRGVLQDRHGLDPTAVTWVTTADERATGLQTPTDIRLARVRDGRDPVRLLAAGDVDAVLLPRAPADRHAQLCPLWSDPLAAQSDYFLVTGVFPVMHLVVIRERLVAERPEVVPALLEMFRRARGMAAAQPAVAGVSAERSRLLLGSDPWTYGLTENQHVVDVFLQYCLDQGLIARKPCIEQIFVSDAVDYRRRSAHEHRLG